MTMEQLVKPLIIINCSDLKSEFDCRPIDMYIGNNSLATLIRSKDRILDQYAHNVLRGLRQNYLTARFSSIADVYVLSAEYGLIDMYGGQISPYNAELKDTPEAIQEFVNHKKEASRQLLRSAIQVERPVYVCMTNKYLKAFKAISGTLLDRLPNLYISEGHVGIGDLRGRLNQVCSLIAKTYVHFSPDYLLGDTDCFYPTAFRSGTTCKNEMDVYYRNRECIGSSLHYVNGDNLSSDHLDHLISIVNSTKRNNQVFLDNGFFSNSELNAKWVLDQYQSIVNRVRNPHALSIVVPDSLDPIEAVKLLAEHKEQILSLCNSYVRVILPIHDYGSTKCQQRYMRMMLEVLEYHPNITAGIPSLKARAYPLSKVQTVLALKAPDGRRAFEGAHFLGLGQTKSTRVRYGRRLLIAQLTGMCRISFDANRTCALWGNKAENKRKCTKLENQLDRDLNLPPSGRGVFDHLVTYEYDLGLVKKFYTESLSFSNYEMAIKLLNLYVPEKHRIPPFIGFDAACTLARSKVAFFRKVNWLDLTRLVLAVLVEHGFITYHASRTLNYYDKRKACYAMHLSQEQMVTL